MNKLTSRLASIFFGIIISFFALFIYTAPTAALAYSCPCSLWNNTTTPSNPADTDSNGVEIGTKFTSDVNGVVTGIKFYKGTNNTGTHIGNLWSSDGTLLATVTFSNETGSGWQQANFSSPVSITANTTYIVSYYAPNGHYAGDNNYFTNTYDNAPLHAPSTNNGVYTYGSSSSFPTSTYQASNYWVDVLFQPTNTKTPIAVITSNANHFSQYYPELLHAEGLNEFDTIDISSVSATTLANYDIVILGEMSLTSDQVTTLSDWVNTGGNLIAMRPDKQLASLLGLTDASSTLSDKYLLVNTSSGPGVGIVNKTIQFHNTADLYTVNGATVVATLYSDASTATSNPAVTMRSVGSNGGHAAAFTYDLAKSVIYTRQGNPAYAGQQLDGNSPPTRADNLFQQNYLDMNKVAIPQADEQQRLLANMITQFDLNNKPLPRFWYLPKGLKAAIVYTLDDHNNVGAATQTVFDKFNSNSPTNCSVTNWECYRGTSWFYVGIPLTDSQAGSYNSQGFEMGVHVQNGCTDFTSFSNLDSSYTSQLAAFQSAYPSLPAQTTHRFHCIVWSDWLTQAKVERSHNIRYSMDYYYWPPAWVNGRPGLFTGSGIPMKFADTDGSTIDVYQGVSQFVNENGIPYDQDVYTLLNNATGSNGYYGLFGTHDDYRDSSFSDSIINAAKAFNVPIITAKQALTWIDARNNSSFSSLSWDGNRLNFTVNADSNANNIQAMIPVNDANNGLTSITRNGSSVTFTEEYIKGVYYAFFPATSGSYSATYSSSIITPTPTPTTSPSASSSLWSNTIIPNNPSANDTNAVEVGVKFKSDISGQVTGIKFYKGLGNTGTHVGHLWSANGTLLATVTFSNETGSGWQQANLNTPVSLSANTTYVVSYYAPNGHYAADLNYLASDYDNAPLHAPSSSNSSGNGVYAYGSSGTFPNNTFNAANYWVDVIFQQDTQPTSTPTATPTSTPTVTLWGNTTPTNTAFDDSNAVELGVKFTPDVNGQITGIRFYKGTGNTGTHIGNLWSSTGTLLASVTFSNESSSGWQEATFSNPVNVTANTTYVASYYAPNGHYAVNSNYFSSAFDNSPLHAPSSSNSGGNGVYVYGSDSFPNSSYNATNYWVDVLFHQ